MHNYSDLCTTIYTIYFLFFDHVILGKEAVEAKNVALPLLAGQNSFMKHGIIQLFKENHPQRGCNWKKSQK